VEAGSAVNKTGSVLFKADSGIDEAEEAFNNALFEAIVPNTLNEDGTIGLHVDGRIAIRLRDYTGIQFETLWAELHPEHSSEEVTLEWLPVDEGDSRDIWVLVQPNETWYLGDLLTIAAGGANRDGTDVQSGTFTVQVESGDDFTTRETDDSPTPIDQPDYNEINQGIGHDATLTIATDVPQIGDIESTTAYRIKPDNVFDNPQRVWLPIPSGAGVDDITLIYYKGNEPNQGWHNAEDVEGFLTEDEPILLDGYYGFIVHHAGIVRLQIGL